MSDGGKRQVWRRLFVLAALAGAAVVAHERPARADFKVYSPYVVKGEAEIETEGFRSFDRAAAKNDAHGYNLALAYTPTDYWRPEIEGEWAGSPGGGAAFVASTFENVFQLTPQGEYAVDFGALAEISRGFGKGNPDSVNFGPIVAKSFGRLDATLNLFFAHDIGPNGSGGTAVTYAAQAKWRWRPAFQPGVEFFGDPGTLGRFRAYGDQDNRAGPVIVGYVPLPSFGLGAALRYDVGYLFGASRAAPSGTLKGQVEYEFYF